MSQMPGGSKSEPEKVPCIRCSNPKARIVWGVPPPREFGEWLHSPTSLTWNKCLCPNPECGASHFSSNDRTYLIVYQKQPGLKREGFGARRDGPIYIRPRGKKLAAIHRLVR